MRVHVLQGRNHKPRPLDRIYVYAVAGFLAMSALAACVSDQRYAYWVLNDSDDQVVLDVRELFHRTQIVPPHTYGALFAGMGVPDKGWKVGIVDGQCAVLQTWPVDSEHNLVYVSPTGIGELVADNPWSHGLRTATQAVLAQKALPCP